jgi:hypothetical protein
LCLNILAHISIFTYGKMVTFTHGHDEPDYIPYFYQRYGGDPAPGKERDAGKIIATSGEGGGLAPRLGERSRKNFQAPVSSKPA